MTLKKRNINILKMNVVEARSKIKIQKEYCEKNNVLFVADVVFCPNCDKMYWKQISHERAGKEHVRSCGYCNYDF